MVFREHQIQASCVLWFRYKYPGLRKLLFAIPNGVKAGCGSRKERAIKGARLKAEGVESGVADIFLSIPSGNYHGLYIEVKAPGQKQSPTQREFEAAVVARGYLYALIESLDEFQALVTNYLSSTKNELHR